MKANKTPSLSSDEVIELFEGLPRMTFFPGENEKDFVSLEHAYMTDLSPGTAYETSLVENLVKLEWEADRHRSIRDNLILAKIRDLAIGAFQNGEAGQVLTRDKIQEVEDLAFGLVSTDKKRRLRAALILTETDIGRAELLAKAYQEVLPTLQFHEQQLANIEVRKRLLREEFDKLKAKRKKTSVADAVVLESK